MSSKRTSIFTVPSPTNPLPTPKKYDFESSNTNTELDGQIKMCENNNDYSKSTNVVGDIMWPIIWFLKLSGYTPLTLSYVQTPEPTTDLKSNTDPRRENGGGVGFMIRNYKVHFKSLSFLWTTFCALWMLSSLAVLLNENLRPSSQSGLLLGIQKTVENVAKNGSVSVDVLGTSNKVISCCLVINQVFDLILSWAESSSLAKFLNSSAPVQQEFQLIFPYLAVVGGRHRKLKRTRNALFIFYVVLPTIFFMTLLLYALETSPFSPLILVALPFAWHSSAVTFMEDVKIIMTYRILAEGFGQIRDGIIHSLKWEKVTLGKVKSWVRLVHMVRLQVVNAGQTQKSHELLLISGSIVVTTGLVLVILQTPWSAPGSGVLILLNCGFVAYVTGRLYLKILASSSITNEEGLIAHQLVTINSNDDDVRIQMESKFLHNMITQNPSVISFGSYVNLNLNKGLILRISSQIVTYIIVLMQFTNT